MQSLVVAHEGIEVRAVVLRNDHVHEAAALLAASRNEVRVGRRDDDQRDEADVVGQTLVLLLVALELFLAAALHAAVDFLGGAVLLLIESLHHEKLFAVADDLRVDGVGAALAEREIIDRVQQVGLAHTVVSDEAVQLRGKGKLRLTDILVV